MKCHFQNLSVLKIRRKYCMNFNKCSNLKTHYDFLNTSKYYWIHYDKTAES